MHLNYIGVIGLFKIQFKNENDDDLDVLSVDVASY